MITARDGKQTISCLKSSEHVDLLLSDVIIPQMNGRELYEELRKLAPDLQVLYLSGCPRDIIHERSVLDPAIGFLQKPFTVQQILSKVRSVPERRLS